MEVNSLLVVFITGTALPLIVSIVTKSDGSKGLKQAVTAAGSAVTAALATATTMDGTAIISTETLASALIAWVSAMAAYNGLYKPNSVNEKVLPGFGLGTSVLVRSLHLLLFGVDLAGVVDTAGTGSGEPVPMTRFRDVVRLASWLTSFGGRRATARRRRPRRRR